jgi:Cu/Ag efflux protein CusF
MKHFIPSTTRAIVMMAAFAVCFSMANTASAQEKPQKHRGPVVSVDTTANTITIDHKKKGKLTLQCEDNVKVKPKSVGGLSGIKPGMQVICYSPPAGGDVMSIRVKEPQTP